VTVKPASRERIRIGDAFPPPAGTGLNKALPIPSKLRKTLNPAVWQSANSVPAGFPWRKQLQHTSFCAPVIPRRTRPAETAGACGLLFHDLRRANLRRAAARNLRRAGAAEGVIVKIGGWRTRSVFERYAIASQTGIADMLKKLEASQDGRRSICQLGDCRKYRRNDPETFIKHATWRHFGSSIYWLKWDSGARV
jgi:hypothetical protein